MTDVLAGTLIMAAALIALGYWWLAHDTIDADDNTGLADAENEWDAVRNFIISATNKQNHENRPGAQRNSSTGVRGVSWHKAAQKWRARVKHYGVEHHLGLFSSIDDAEAAAVAARNRLYTHNALDRGVA